VLSAAVSAGILKPFYPFTAVFTAPEMPLNLFPWFFKPDNHYTDWEEC
jgi:hypothetical protein